MEVINLNDLKSLNLNILPYGSPGCGKTRFLGTVGEVLYTLAVDVDNGFKTMKMLPRAMTDNIVTVRMTSFKDIDAIYQLVLKNDPERWAKALGIPVKKPFEAVGFDTWSEVSWEIIKEKRVLLKKAGDGLGFRENIQIQDWGAITDLNHMAIEAFTDAPITFICTMHEQMYTDDKAGITMGVPSINGKFAPEVGKYFDVQGHMYVDLMGKYMMDTIARAKFQGKSRLKLDKSIGDPTFKKLWDAIADQR